MSKPVLIPADKVFTNSRIWPRRALNREKVAEFFDKYVEEGTHSLPLLEVVEDEDGDYLIADGHHRLEALRNTNAKEYPAIVLTVPEGQDCIDFGYQHALHRSAISAQPLTRIEKKSAAARLIKEHPDVADREIARITGLSHQTVARLRKAAIEPDMTEIEESAGDAYMHTISADEIATKLVYSAGNLWFKRGLLDVIDGDRVGKRLARSLAEAYPHNPLPWAQRFLSWFQVAIAELEQQGLRK